MNIATRRAAVALVAVALATVACADVASNSSSSSVSPWTEVSASPLSPRYSALAFWVGERAVVLGGFASDPCPPGADCALPAEPPLSDGAAFDPETNSWERITQAPVPIGWASGAVVGDTLYLWASENHPQTRPAFLAYSLSQDRWDELPMPEAGEDRTYVLASHGDRIVAYQTTQEFGVRPDFEFDPSMRSWVELPADPLASSFDRTMVGTDAGLVLLGIENVPQPGSTGPAVYRAAILDSATGQWRGLADSEITGYDPSWFWAGGVVVNPTVGTSDGGDNSWGRAYPHGGVLDPARGTWASLPDPPAAGAYFPPAAVGGSEYVASFSGWALHVSSGRWFELGSPPEGASDEQAITWAGDRLFVWGGVRWNDGEPTILDDGWLWSAASEPEEQRASAADVARIVCQPDGTTSVLTPEVAAQPDGVRLVVDNRLDEPASLVGGFGFDADPGVSEWIVQTGPGDRAVACWPFSAHGGGTEPATVPLEVLDPEGLYVPPAELECPGDEQWSQINDFIQPTSGIAADPVEAVRRSVTGLEPDDVVSEHRSGYPEAENDGTATVTVSRDGRIVAVFGLSLADDGRWLINGGEGCAGVGIS